MKQTLVTVLLLLASCATTVTHIDRTETFPGYSMRTYVFGSAKMAESAQNFHGSLIVLRPDGGSVTVNLDNGQSAKGLEATGLEAVVESLVKTIIHAIGIP